MNKSAFQVLSLTLIVLCARSAETCGEGEGRGGSVPSDPALAKLQQLATAFTGEVSAIQDRVNRLGLQMYAERITVYPPPPDWFVTPAPEDARARRREERQKSDEGGAGPESKRATFGIEVPNEGHLKEALAESIRAYMQWLDFMSQFYGELTSAIEARKAGAAGSMETVRAVGRRLNDLPSDRTYLRVRGAAQRAEREFLVESAGAWLSKMLAEAKDEAQKQHLAAASDAFETVVESVRELEQIPQRRREAAESFKSAISALQAD